MSISISSQTDVVSGAVGGLLIAGSTTLLLSLTGEMATMSGLLHALVHGRDGALTGWRVSFTAGLLAAGATAAALGSHGGGAALAVRPAAALLAGALVGYGTRLGNGCTSGHGVSGLSRFSPRSLAAVLTFMATGMATATAVGAFPALQAFAFDAAAIAAPGSWGVALQSLAAAGAVVAAGWSLFHLGTGPSKGPRSTAPTPRASAGGASPVAAPATPSAAPAVVKSTPASVPASGSSAVWWRTHAAALAAGGLFGAGLLVSGMASPAKVLGFLNPLAPGGWDLTLVGVMGAAVAFNAVSFSWLHSTGAPPVLLRPRAPEGPKADAAPAAAQAPPAQATFKDLIALGPAHPRNTLIDARLLGGAALFGAGWGLLGVCPGPSVVAIGAGAPFAAAFVPAMLLGMLAYDLTLGDGLERLRRARGAATSDEDA